MYSSLTAFVGTPPVGMEPIVYLFAIFVTLFFLDLFASFIFSVFGGLKR